MDVFASSTADDGLQAFSERLLLQDLTQTPVSRRERLNSSCRPVDGSGRRSREVQGDKLHRLQQGNLRTNPAERHTTRKHSHLSVADGEEAHDGNDQPERKRNRQEKSLSDHLARTSLEAARRGRGLVQIGRLTRIELPRTRQSHTIDGVFVRTSDSHSVGGPQREPPVRRSARPRPSNHPNTSEMQDNANSDDNDDAGDLLPPGQRQSSNSIGWSATPIKMVRRLSKENLKLHDRQHASREWAPHPPRQQNIARDPPIQRSQRRRNLVNGCALQQWVDGAAQLRGMCKAPTSLNRSVRICLLSALSTCKLFSCSCLSVSFTVFSLLLMSAPHLRTTNAIETVLNQSPVYSCSLNRK